MEGWTMTERNYWTGLAKRTVTRRRLIRGSATGLGLAAVALTGCASPRQANQSASQNSSATEGQTASTPQSGGTLNVYLTTNYPLDAQKNSGAGQVLPGSGMSRVFRFKTSSDPHLITDHDLENDLGVSAESPEALSWTVKLRPDARFQDMPPVGGHAVEAEDVKATFVRAVDPATVNPNRGALNMIDPAQIQTPDKTTVVFKLTYPYAPFRQILASPTYSWIYPREVLTGGFDPNKHPIGSGPFVLDSATPDVGFTFKKSPTWFEQSRPYVDVLRIAVIPDSSQQLAQFTAGNLDELILDNPNDVEAMKRSNPRAAVVKADNAGPWGLYFQLGDPTSPFQDLRVRQAISLAIDRAALGKAVYAGEYQQVVFIPSYMGKWSLKVQDLDSATQQYYKANPAEAKKLLEAAGQTNLQVRFMEITGSSATTPAYYRNGDAIANMLNAVGIKTTTVNEDFISYIDSGHGIRQGFFDKDIILYFSVANYSDADEWLFNYLHSKSTTNQEHLKDPTLEAMVDKERTLVNEDERLKAVLDIQKYLAEKLYYVSSVGTYQWVGVHPRVQNYNFSNSLGKATETYAKLWLKA